MHRYELTDAQWDQIAAYFPDCGHDGGPGAPWKDHRRMVNGILWHLHIGSRGQTSPSIRPVEDRLRPLPALAPRRYVGADPGRAAAALDRAGLIDRDLWLVDATVIRASRAAAGAKKKSAAAARAGRP